MAAPEAAPFRLVAGRPAPRQSGATDCGPTALTTARMLVDPALATWVLTGAAGGRAFPGTRPDVAAVGTAPAAVHARFTAYSRLVHDRTTALLGPGGRLQLPWPRALGTPPWGLCRELESMALPAGTRYRTVLVRSGTPQRWARLVEVLATRIGPGQPGALYVGSPWLPRHVALLVPAVDGPGLAVYDPGAGTVVDLDDGLVRALGEGRARVGGWPQPWFLAGPVSSGAGGRVTSPGDRPRAS